MASQGPRYPGTTANLSNAGTSENAEAWVSPGNVGADDGTEATITAATYDSPDISQILVASNFGFTIPTGSTIDGIVVEIDRRNSAGAASDNRVQLAKGTTFASLVGTNKADTATDWPTTTASVSYGGTADLWGTTWTVSEINASSFAVFLSVQADAANTDIQVDYVRVTVHYTAPISGGFSLSHGHSVSASGVPGRAGAFAQSHPHSQAFAGKKGALAGFAVSHGSTVSDPSGVKGGIGSISVSHPHDTSFTGVAEEGQDLSGEFLLDHGHAVSFSGVKGSAAAFDLDHPGEVAFSGSAARGGSFAVSLESSVTASGAKGAVDGFEVSSGHSTVFSGSGARQGSFGISHGAETAFSGFGEGGPQESGGFDLTHAHSVAFAGAGGRAGTFEVDLAHAVAFSGFASRSATFGVSHPVVIAFSGGAVPVGGPWSVTVTEGGDPTTSEYGTHGATLSDRRGFSADATEGPGGAD